MKQAAFYYQDPHAPRPNRPSHIGMSVILFHGGRVLLEQRSDCGLWGLIGGGLELDETLATGALREVWEETGLRLDAARLRFFKLYDDPGRIGSFPDGNILRLISFCYTYELDAEPSLRLSRESRALRFVSREEIKNLSLCATHAPILEDFYAARDAGTEGIGIEYVLFAEREAFWAAHIHYLIEDGIVKTEEEKAYFAGAEYRDVIARHMQREQDRLYMLYFVQQGQRIGAAQYVIFHSEDGKCVLMDFWLFPPYRNQGRGRACYRLWEARVRAEGASYCQLNCERENALRFWRRLGYRDDGTDEWGMPLLRKDWQTEEARK